MLLAEVNPIQRAAADDDEIAALIVRRNGHATQWRLSRLDHDSLVDAWERGALLRGRHYAVLFASELAKL
jgi:hypothetical protein